MLISHTHRFIFIKTYKTAGTSLEIALSKYLTDGDVITPISALDEQLRRSLGFRGPQNYCIPFKHYQCADYAWLLLRGKRQAFYNHAPASFIQRYVEPHVWNTYFKFCVERNPWDKAVSWYFYRNQSPNRPAISTFLQQNIAKKLRGYDLYANQNQLLVDRVFRYEDLNSQLAELAELLRLPEVPTLPRAKGTQRTDRRHYREILADSERELINKVFSREIELLNYTW